MGSILLPPSCHGTKMCLPQLVDCLTSLSTDPLKRHRAAQAATALAKIHQLKKKGIVPHSLALQQIVEFARKASIQAKLHSKMNRNSQDYSDLTASHNGTELKTNGETETEVSYLCYNLTIFGILFYLSFSCVQSKIQTAFFLP